MFERAYAMGGHTATRALVYLSVFRASALPVSIALVGFALVDGAARYGKMRGWDWTSDRVLIAFHGWAVMVTIVMIGAWWVQW